MARGGHFVCMDGLTGWVLQSERIASESEEALAPVVRRTVELFGDPVAVVRDLGQAGEKAVAFLRERGIPDLICHRHFLEAVGIRILEHPYDRLRTLLRGIGLRAELLALRKELRLLRQQAAVGDASSNPGEGQVREELLCLVHWLLEGDGKADPPFPFALTHLELVLRCKGALDPADKWVPRPRSMPEQRAMRRLEGLLHKLDKETRIRSTVAELHDGRRAFAELRDVLRLTDSELPGCRDGCRQLPLPQAEVARLHQIEMAVNQYEQDLRDRVHAQDSGRRSTSPAAIVLAYVLKYRPRLFGHPAIRDAEDRIVAAVERTNNRSEQFFANRTGSPARSAGERRLDARRRAPVRRTQTLRSPDWVHSGPARAFVPLLPVDVARLPPARRRAGSALVHLSAPSRRTSCRKQQTRRRIGRADLAHDLQQQPAQAMLAANVRFPDYVKVVCAPYDSLANAFARLSRTLIAKVKLVRDHRDSRLESLVRRLLKGEPPGSLTTTPPPSQVQPSS